MISKKTMIRSNKKNLKDASFVKEDSLCLKVKKLVQELALNFKIKTKNDLELFTETLLSKNEFIFNKPSLLLTCNDFLKVALILLNKSSFGTFKLDSIKEITKNLKKTNYKFSTLKAYNIPKDQIKINSKADINKWRKILKDRKLNNLNKILKSKRFKLGKTYSISNRLVFDCVNLKDKLIELSCNIIFNALIKIKKLHPKELYSYSSLNTNLNFQYDWSKTSFTPRYINKLDVSEFFLSLKKKFVILGINQIIPKSDILFYSLLKNLFTRGYKLKIARFSKRIGSKKILRKNFNVSIFKVYQGTVLAPVVSNLVNFLIIKELNKLLLNFNSGKRTKKNKIKEQYSKKLYKEKNKKTPNMDKIKLYKKKIYKIKPIVFSNNFKRAKIFIYCDDLLLLTHLSKKQNLTLIDNVKQIYNKFSLKFNPDKIKLTYCFNNNNGISFLGFYLRGPNIIGRNKKNFIKSNCRIGIDTIKLRNKLDILGILKKRLILTGNRDRNKELKNKKKKRHNIYMLSQNEKKIRNKLIFDPNYKVLPLLPIATLSPKNILLFFYHKMQGLVNYFKYCDYTSYLQYFLWTFKMSCLKTFCAKFRVRTVKGLFRKFDENLKKLNVNALFCKLEKLSQNNVFEKLRLRKADVLKSSNVNYETFKKNLFPIQISTQSDLEKLFCVICNSTDNLELHHVKNIASIRSGIKKLMFNYKNTKFLEHNAKSIFNLIHIAKKRKQIVVCFNCHVKIHNKTIEKQFLDKFIKKL